MKILIGIIIYVVSLLYCRYEYKDMVSDKDKNRCFFVCVCPILNSVISIIILIVSLVTEIKFSINIKEKIPKFNIIYKFFNIKR